MICSYQSFILPHDVKRCAHAANTVATSIRGFDVIGPNLPFIALPDAAMQLHQTGHSSILQHFRRVKVANADQTAIRRGCSIGAAVAKAARRMGGKPPGERAVLDLVMLTQDRVANVLSRQVVGGGRACSAAARPDQAAHYE